MVGEGSSLNVASQQGAGGSCVNCFYKIIKKFPRSLRFYKLNSCLRHLISQFAKLLCFGGFIVTIFIMLVLIEKLINQAFR